MLSRRDRRVTYLAQNQLTRFIHTLQTISPTVTHHPQQ